MTYTLTLYRRISTALMVAVALALSACSTLPDNISMHEVESFTPVPVSKRSMNEVKVHWEVREDVAEYCAKSMKMGAEQAYLTPPVACASWNKRTQECTIVTGTRTNHVALGHELRHCFEGHFHS